MLEILSIILTTIVPIVIIASLGALLDHFWTLETRTISRLAIYVVSPALAFQGMANSTIGTVNLGELLLFTVLSTSMITFVTWLITYLLRLDRVTASAFILSTSLLNVVNYGIPLNEFAFGPIGRELAIVVGIFGGLYSYTMGVFLASWGRASIKQALTNMLTVPMVYAAVIGLAVNLGSLPIPTLLTNVTGVLSDAAVPMMLLLLGVQIYRSSIQGQWTVIAGASLLRLIGGAVAGFLFAYLLGLEGALRQVAIVGASMPTGVTAVVLATEFESDAQVVSSTVLFSTLLSLVTLPVVIYLVS